MRPLASLHAPMRAALRTALHATGRRARRFCRSRSGSATVEFAILFPFYVTLFLSTVELGMVNFRHSMLERGLDLAVRDVRLGTGTHPTHDDIRDAICTYAGVLPDCTQNLRLEMTVIDPRNYVAPAPNADCVDHSIAVTPLREFTNGGDNDMVMLRACFVFNPVFPTTGLGYQLQKDGAGYAAMVATSAFVQEPS